MSVQISVLGCGLLCIIFSRCRSGPHNSPQGDPATNFLAGPCLPCCRGERCVGRGPGLGSGLPLKAHHSTSAPDGVKIEMSLHLDLDPPCWVHLCLGTISPVLRGRTVTSETSLLANSLPHVSRGEGQSGSPRRRAPASPRLPARIGS